MLIVYYNLLLVKLYKYYNIFVTRLSSDEFIDLGDCKLHNVAVGVSETPFVLLKE